MIIFNLNVLARPGEGIGSRQPDPEGMRMWRYLHEATLGRMAVVIDDDPDVEHLEHWLRTNTVKAATYDIMNTSDPAMKAEKIQLLSSVTGRVDWYIDNDPATIALTLRKGMPSLLMLTPWTVRPEWHEETSHRSWDAIVSEVDRQSELRAERNWRDL
jgi:hypothetical protein